MRPEELADILERARATRVVVAGDPCLDENVYGAVESVAREAPVVAFEASDSVFAPGQAANVAGNAAALGAAVYFLGVAGDDEQRGRLTELLAGFGVDAGGLIVEAGRPTTHKVKFVTRDAQRHGQHVFHAYRQERKAPEPGTLRRMRTLAADALGEADAVVLSDYGNGTLTSGFAKWLIEESAGRQIPSVANARGDLKKFRGADAAVANMGELAALTCTEALAPDNIGVAMEAAAATLKVHYVIITGGSEGMYVWPGRGRTRHLVSAATQVTDVTGAGDTVTAALAVALGAGVSLSKAAAFANLAAAAAVSCEGTAAAHAEELKRFL